MTAFKRHGVSPSSTREQVVYVHLSARVLKNEGRRNVISQKRRKVYEFEDGIIEGLIAKFTLLAI